MTPFFCQHHLPFPHCSFRQFSTLDLVHDFSPFCVSPPASAIPQLLRSNYSLYMIILYISATAVYSVSYLHWQKHQHISTPTSFWKCTHYLNSEYIPQIRDLFNTLMNVSLKLDPGCVEESPSLDDGLIYFTPLDSAVVETNFRHAIVTSATYNTYHQTKSRPHIHEHR